MLDHVIALNEEHLRRLIRDYVRYHHEDRIHDSLGKDTPNRRSVETKPATDASLIFAAAPGQASPSQRVAPSGIEDHRRRIPSLPDDVPRVRQAVPATTRTLANLRRSGS
jgi:hypothetical protein